jgi:hypothetical protein
VEIFFNLMWVAVTVALIAAWFAALRRPGIRPLGPAIGLQLIALAILAAILLPAISLTDDLQATVNPAETEHLSRRAGLQGSPDQQSHSQPVPFAPPVAAFTIPSRVLLGFMTAKRPVSQQAFGVSQGLPTRAPPTATDPALT